MISKDARDYLALIGRKGGLKSRRVLSRSDARRMVALRLARQAHREFRVSCFWSFRDVEITGANLGWVVEQLQRNGNRSAWQKAATIRSLMCP